MKNSLYKYALASKLAAAIGMRRTTLASLPLFRLLLARVAILLVYAFLIAMLAGILVVICLLYIYRFLIANGLDQNAALIGIGTIIIFAIIILWLAGMNYVRSVHAISKQLITMQHPIANRINNIANAFIDGIINPSKR